MWKVVHIAHSEDSAKKIKDMLTMRSGFKTEGGMRNKQQDWVDYYLSRPLFAQPGTRYSYDSIETYFVDHLNEDTCILIYKKYSGDSKDESNEYIKEIVKLADYHTITIELIAKIQKANHTNAEKMLAILNEKGFNLENITSKVSVDNGSDKAKFNEHMAKLFDISNITDDIFIETLENKNISEIVENQILFS